jgi:hypothetical protein
MPIVLRGVQSDESGDGSARVQFLLCIWLCGSWVARNVALVCEWAALMWWAFVVAALWERRNTATRGDGNRPSVRATYGRSQPVNAGFAIGQRRWTKPFHTVPNA